MGKAKGWDPARNAFENENPTLLASSLLQGAKRASLLILSELALVLFGFDGGQLHNERACEHEPGASTAATVLETSSTGVAVCG